MQLRHLSENDPAYSCPWKSRRVIHRVVDSVVRTRGDHLRAAIARAEIVTERRDDAIYVAGGCIESREHIFFSTKEPV